MIEFFKVSELAFESVIFECFEEPEKIGFYSAIRAFLIEGIPDLHRIAKTLYKDIRNVFPCYRKLVIRPMMMMHH